MKTSYVRANSESSSVLGGNRRKEWEITPPPQGIEEDGGNDGTTRCTTLRFVFASDYSGTYGTRCGHAKRKDARRFNSRRLFRIGPGFGTRLRAGYYPDTSGRNYTWLGCFRASAGQSGSHREAHGRRKRAD